MPVSFRYKSPTHSGGALISYSTTRTVSLRPAAVRPVRVARGSRSSYAATKRLRTAHAISNCPGASPTYSHFSGRGRSHAACSSRGHYQRGNQYRSAYSSGSGRS